MIATSQVMTWNSSVDGDGALWSAPVALERGRALSLRFEYEQGDATGTHPAFALQWDLQGGGGGAFDAAVAAAAAADATVLVLGGGTSVTSGEGVDRASLGLPGAQLALAQAVVGASARRHAARDRRRAGQTVCRAVDQRVRASDRRGVAGRPGAGRCDRRRAVRSCQPGGPRRRLVCGVG